jgi:predicted aspartyl protease
MVITALWDTGATHSVIDNKTAETLGLTPVDWGVISGVNSERTAAIALVDILLPNHILFENHRVSIADVKSADMLIGMDIICRGDFIICNSENRTSFSFAMPPFTDRPDWIQKSDYLNSL